MPIEFHERKGLSWCKLYDRWFHCESHADIPGDILGTGTYLLLQANRWGRQPDGSGLVVSKIGAPLTAAQLAARLRCPEAYIEAVIDALVLAETIEITGDGAICFPNLQRWQEDPSTQRKRRQRRPSEPSDRDIHADIPRECHADVHAESANLGVKVTRRGSEDQISSSYEEERERAADAAPAQPSLPATEPKSTEGQNTTERLAPIVARFNEGIRAGNQDAGAVSKVSEARLPGKTTAGRDRLLSIASGRFSDPEGWFWLSRALAGSWKATSPQGFDGYSLGWLLGSGRGVNWARLEEHWAKGEALREQVAACGSAAAAGVNVRVNVTRNVPGTFTAAKRPSIADDFAYARRTPQPRPAERQEDDGAQVLNLHQDRAGAWGGHGT